jgi:hypothetical protein
MKQLPIICEQDIAAYTQTINARLLLWTINTLTMGDINMGIGTYGINNDTQRAVCIDMIAYAGKDENGDYIDLEDFHYEDVIEKIYCALSTTFIPVKNTCKDNHRIIAESNLLSIEAIGWEHDVGLRVKIKDDLDYNQQSIAFNALESASRRLFNKLADYLSLRIKTSGYTSAEYAKQ